MSKTHHGSARFLVKTALAATALLLLSACAGGGGGEAVSSAGTKTTLELSVGTLPFSTLAPFHIADEEGRFKDAGLTIKTHEAASGAAQVAALMAGDIDITYTNFVTAFQASQQGLPVQIFLVNDLGSTGKDLNSGLMVEPGSPIQKPADLKGKKIAINSLGAVMEMTTRRIMEDAGVGEGDYELVEIPPPNMIAALDGGQVDAAWIAEPFLTIGIQSSGLRQVAPAFYGRTAGIPQSGWVTTKQFAEKNQEALASFTTVMKQVLEESTADKAQAKVKEAIPTFTDISADVAGKFTYLDFDPANDLDGLPKLQDEMIRYKILDGPVDLEQLVFKP
ncbi:ABC transporter substrate-binding protein [Pseudarthrobacter sp. NPDC058196]|uniref:ABC transporter substrate-binding protein n=1 Tax=Pseudarthrobacter sp. NPDC058196 TaxID=3346376 RepID=UPI0036DEDF0B